MSESMRRNGSGRLRAALLATGVVALAWAGAAAADREQIHLTSEGQAAAKAAVLTRADLGTDPGWTGGARKPDLSASMPCTTFHPKQSDLVLVGAAQTTWKHTGLQFDSEAQVLATPAMVRLDWRRTVLAPQLLPCLRSGLAHALGGSAKLVSLRRIAFPRVATYTRAYRALADVTVPNGTVRVLVDLVLVGRGRTEVTLTTTAPAVAAAAVRTAEIRLARVLASRIRA